MTDLKELFSPEYKELLFETDLLQDNKIFLQHIQDGKRLLQQDNPAAEEIYFCTARINNDLIKNIAKQFFSDDKKLSDRLNNQFDNFTKTIENDYNAVFAERLQDDNFSKYFMSLLLADFQSALEYLRQFYKTKKNFNKSIKDNNGVHSLFFSDCYSAAADLFLPIFHSQNLIDFDLIFDKIARYIYTIALTRSLLLVKTGKDFFDNIDFLLFGQDDKIPIYSKISNNLYFGEIEKIDFYNAIKNEGKQLELKTVNYQHYVLMLNLWRLIKNSHSENDLLVLPIGNLTGGEMSRLRERLDFLMFYTVDLTLPIYDKKAKQTEKHYRFRTIRQTVGTQKGYKISKANKTLSFFPTKEAFAAIQEIDFRFISQFDFDEITNNIDFFVCLYLANELEKENNKSNYSVKIEKFINDNLPLEIRESKTFKRNPIRLKNAVKDAFQKFCKCTFRAAADGQEMIEYESKHGYFDFENLTYSAVKNPIKAIKQDEEKSIKSGQ